MLINGKELNLSNFKFKVKHYMALCDHNIDYFDFLSKIGKFYETQNMSDIPAKDMINFLSVILDIECGITREDLSEVEFWDLFKIVTQLFPNGGDVPEEDKTVGE